MNRKPSPSAYPSQKVDGDFFAMKVLKDVFEAEICRAIQTLPTETLRDLASLCFDYEVGSDSDKIEVFETIIEILRDEPLTAEKLVSLDETVTEYPIDINLDDGQRYHASVFVHPPCEMSGAFRVGMLAETGANERWISVLQSAIDKFLLENNMVRIYGFSVVKAVNGRKQVLAWANRKDLHGEQ